MIFLQTALRALDKFTESCGKALAWLCLAMMLSMTLTVFLRYGLNIGSVLLQESTLYMHASLFMLASAYTLKNNGHVRVDVFFRKFSAYKQAWVNLLGTILLLMPVMAFIGWASWAYVEASWSIHEVSPEPGGIPAVYLLKSLIPLMTVLMLIQGLAEIIRNLLVITGASTEASEDGLQ